jgi:hypothetical protein
LWSPPLLITEDLFLLGVILSDPLQASLNEAFYVVWIKGQTKVEDLRVVAVVITDGGSPSEGLVPSSPTG